MTATRPAAAPPPPPAADPADRVRAELVPHAAALRDRCEALRAELAAEPEAPAEFRARVDKLADAAGAFRAYAENPRWADEDVWHRLRNLLAVPSSTCQRLRGTDRVAQFGRFLPDLQAIADRLAECLRAVDRLEAAGGPVPPGPPPPAGGPPGSAGSPPAPPVVRAAEPARVLVVEDDPDIRAEIAAALEAAGHDVYEAKNGEQALRQVDSVPFDLVLLDHNLPGMSGREVLTQIRGSGRMTAVPVLMASGAGDLGRVVACIEAGAADYLVKPVEPVLLRAKVNLFLQRRRDHLRVLEQFFPPEVARQVADRPDLADRPMDKEVTVLFCDIRGFSRVSEKVGAATTVGWVRAVMERLSDCVLARGGVLVDLIGDELMAMWGAPSDQPDHAARACAAALDMLAAVPGLDGEWAGRLGGERTAVGIGINSGPAQVGNTGTRRKFKYGVLGNTVNLASRIQGATKYLGAPLVVSKSTLDKARAAGPVEARRLAEVRVVNIPGTVHLYEVVAPDRAGWADLRARYEQALEFYETPALEFAAKALGELITEYGPAGPKLALMARTMQALVEPGRWSRVFDLPGK